MSPVISRLVEVSSKPGVGSTVLKTVFKRSREFPDEINQAGFMLHDGSYHYGSNDIGIHGRIAKEHGYGGGQDGESAAIVDGFVRYGMYTEGTKGRAAIHVQFNGLHPDAHKRALKLVSSAFQHGDTVHVDVNQGQWHAFDRHTSGEFNDVGHVEKFMNRATAVVRHRQATDPADPWSQHESSGDGAWTRTLNHFRTNKQSGEPYWAAGELVPTKDLLGYREFDRSKSEKYPGHFKSVKDWISRYGITDMGILSYNPQSGKVYASEGNTRISAAHELGIPYVPMRVYRSGHGKPGFTAPKQYSKPGWIPADIKPSEIGFRTYDGLKESRFLGPDPEQLAIRHGFQEHSREKFGDFGTVIRYLHPSGDNLILTLREPGMTQPVGWKSDVKDILKGSTSNWDSRWEYHTVDGTRSLGYDTWGLENHLKKVRGESNGVTKN